MDTFKTNEKKIMSELDEIVKKQQKGKKKKGGDMKGAVEGAEEIRLWEDHMWDAARLQKELKSDFKQGLDQATAD